MNQSWLLLDSGPCDPAFNMALDQALLESAALIGLPVLRFYSWTQPAASFGYFQKIAEVEKASRLRPLIRRPTGGGIVPHDADWTYSVTVPAGHEWHALKAEQSYQRMHEWIRDSFLRLGVDVELADCCRKVQRGECFSGYEQHDVIWKGRKVAGAAQRRTTTGLLIQGSVQSPVLISDRHLWQKALCDAAEGVWDTQPLHAEVLSLAAQLATDKYATDAYNRKR